MNANPTTQRTTQSEISLISPDDALGKPHQFQFQQEKTRQKIAIVVVIAYITLVILNLVLPMIMYFSYWPPKQPIGISEVKDLMLAISGVLSGFVSILGFIIGYYFKAAEETAGKATGNGKKE